MEKLKALFREINGFVFDDRLMLVFSGANIMGGVHLARTGDPWGVGFAVLAAVVAACSWRSLGKAVRE